MKLTIAEFKKKHRFEPAPRLIKNGKIVCPTCEKNQANFYPPFFGVADCTTCKKKKSNFWVNNPQYSGRYPEFVNQETKDHRVKFFNSTLQPFRDGIPSKEFADAHPQEAKKIFKGEEHKAKNVWSDLPGWHTRDKSQ